LIYNLYFIFYLFWTFLKEIFIEDTKLFTSKKRWNMQNVENTYYSFKIYIHLSKWSNNIPRFWSNLEFSSIEKYRTCYKKFAWKSFVSFLRNFLLKNILVDAIVRLTYSSSHNTWLWLFESILSIILYVHIVKE